MAIVKRDEDGALVGEILVHRPDADAGDLGDPVRGDRTDPVTLQDPHHSVEDSCDRLLRPPLLRLASWRRFRRAGSHSKNVSSSTICVNIPEFQALARAIKMRAAPVFANP
jgi:hypothetical protein